MTNEIPGLSRTTSRVDLFVFLYEYFVSVDVQHLTTLQWPVVLGTVMIFVLDLNMSHDNGFNFYMSHNFFKM